MKLTIQYTPKVDLENVYFTILLIKTGFYRSKGFLITSKLHQDKKLDKLSVLLPRKIFDFGSEFFYEIGKDDPEQLYEDCIQNNKEFTFDPQVKKLIQAQTKQMNNFVQNFHSQHYSTLNNAIDLLNNFFPIENYIEKVELIFKTNGTTCSYKNVKDKTCVIIPRIDASIADIVFCLVCSYIEEFHVKLMELNKGSISWEEKQRMAEFILMKSKVKDITGDYISLTQLLKSKSTIRDLTSLEMESNRLANKVCLQPLIYF